MKKYAIVVILIFTCATVYAIDWQGFVQRWKKPAPREEAKKAVAPKETAKEKQVVPPQAVPQVPVEEAATAPKDLPVIAPVEPSAIGEEPVSIEPQPPVQKEEAAVPEEPVRMPTREEILTRINEILAVRQNLVSAVPGLEAREEGGKTVFVFNGKRIEDLDEETIFKINATISQQISLENLQNLDRQQRQLRNLRQIDQLNRTQRMLREQRELSRPQSSKVYTPPKIPKTTRTKY